MNIVHRCRFTEWQPASITHVSVNMMGNKLAVLRANGDIELWSFITGQNQENRLVITDQYGHTSGLWKYLEKFPVSASNSEPSLEAAAKILNASAEFSLASQWVHDKTIPGAGRHLFSQAVWSYTMQDGEVIDRLFTVGRAGKFIEWDLSTYLPKHIVMANGGDISCACVSPSHAKIALGCYDGTVAIYNITDTTEPAVYVTSLHGPAQTRGVSCLDWLHYSHITPITAFNVKPPSTGGNRNVVSHNTNDQQQKQPGWWDTPLLVVGCHSGRIMVFDINSRRCLHTLRSDMIRTRSSRSVSEKTRRRLLSGYRIKDSDRPRPKRKLLEKTDLIRGVYKGKEIRLDKLGKLRALAAIRQQVKAQLASDKQEKNDKITKQQINAILGTKSSSHAKKRTRKLPKTISTGYRRGGRRVYANAIIRVKWVDAETFCALDRLANLMIVDGRAGNIISKIPLSKTLLCPTDLAIIPASFHTQSLAHPHNPVYHLQYDYQLAPNPARRDLPAEFKPKAHQIAVSNPLLYISGANGRVIELTGSIPTSMDEEVDAFPAKGVVFAHHCRFIITGVQSPHTHDVLSIAIAHPRVQVPISSGNSAVADASTPSSQKKPCLVLLSAGVDTAIQTYQVHPFNFSSNNTSIRDVSKALDKFGHDLSLLMRNLYTKTRFLIAHSLRLSPYPSHSIVSTSSSYVPLQSNYNLDPHLMCLPPSYSDSKQSYASVDPLLQAVQKYYNFYPLDAKAHPDKGSTPEDDSSDLSSSDDDSSGDEGPSDSAHSQNKRSELTLSISPSSGNANIPSILTGNVLLAGVYSCLAQYSTAPIYLSNSDRIPNRLLAYIPINSLKRANDTFILNHKLISLLIRRSPTASYAVMAPPTQPLFSVSSQKCVDLYLLSDAHAHLSPPRLSKSENNSMDDSPTTTRENEKEYPLSTLLYMSWMHDGQVVIDRDALLSTILANREIRDKSSGGLKKPTAPSLGATPMKNARSQAVSTPLSGAQKQSGHGNGWNFDSDPFNLVVSPQYIMGSDAHKKHLAASNKSSGKDAAEMADTSTANPEKPTHHHVLQMAVETMTNITNTVVSPNGKFLFITDAASNRLFTLNIHEQQYSTVAPSLTSTKIQFPPVPPTLEFYLTGVTQDSTEYRNRLHEYNILVSLTNLLSAGGASAVAFSPCSSMLYVSIASHHLEGKLGNTKREETPYSAGVTVVIDLLTYQIIGAMDQHHTLWLTHHVGLSVNPCTGEDPSDQPLPSLDFTSPLPSSIKPSACGRHVATYTAPARGQSSHILRYYQVLTGHLFSRPCSRVMGSFTSIIPDDAVVTNLSLLPTVSSLEVQTSCSPSVTRQLRTLLTQATDGSQSSSAAEPEPSSAVAPTPKRARASMLWSNTPGPKSNAKSEEPPANAAAAQSGHDSEVNTAALTSLFSQFLVERTMDDIKSSKKSKQSKESVSFDASQFPVSHASSQLPAVIICLADASYALFDPNSNTYSLSADAPRTSTPTMGDGSTGTALTAADHSTKNPYTPLPLKPTVVTNIDSNTLIGTKSTSNSITLLSPDLDHVRSISYNCHYHPTSVSRSHGRTTLTLGGMLALLNIMLQTTHDSFIVSLPITKVYSQLVLGLVSDHQPSPSAQSAQQPSTASKRNSFAPTKRKATALTVATSDADLYRSAAYECTHLLPDVRAKCIDRFRPLLSMAYFSPASITTIQSLYSFKSHINQYITELERLNASKDSSSSTLSTLDEEEPDDGSINMNDYSVSSGVKVLKPLRKTQRKQKPTTGTSLPSVSMSMVCNFPTVVAIESPWINIVNRLPNRAFVHKYGSL